MFTLYPSCLHTTLASLLSQPLSHTVPHTPLMQISTLPALLTGPPTKRTVPLVQFWTSVEGDKFVTILKNYYITCCLHVVLVRPFMCYCLSSKSIILYYTPKCNCDKLPLVLGKHRCQVRSHKTISICREASRMKISDWLLVSADVCWYISDYRKTHIGAALQMIVESGALPVVLYSTTVQGHQRVMKNVTLTLASS